MAKRGVWKAFRNAWKLGSGPTSQGEALAACATHHRTLGGQRGTDVAGVLARIAPFGARRFASPPIVEQQKEHEDQGPDRFGREVSEETTSSHVAVDQYLPVNAFHLGRMIDLEKLGKEFPNRPHLSQKDSLIISLTKKPESGWTKDVPFSECYMVAFKYGSVVFFNLDRSKRDKYLETTSKHTRGKSKIPRVEEYGVVIRPALEGWSTFEQDHLLLKRLDINNIRVMSTVLAHTVALDHYSGQVDSMLDVFSSLNQMMEKTGDLTIKKKKLFQLIATNNTTLTDVITKLRLLERSDPAWRYAQYGKIWEGLRQEFEIEERFETLDLKLNLVQNNIKFFLEVLQNRKSDTLEWIIIILISGEICVSIYDLMTRAPGLP